MALLDQPFGRVLLVVTLLVAASLALGLARRRDGALRPVRVPDGAPAALLTQADLGRPLGERATLLQLSSPGCATCPQVRRVLQALAAERPGVVHVEIDAAARLDLARRLEVLRTPTVLVLGAHGELRARTSGRLDPEAAARALDAAGTDATRADTAGADTAGADTADTDALPAGATFTTLETTRA